MALVRRALLHPHRQTTTVHQHRRTDARRTDWRTSTELRLIFKHSPWLGFTLPGHRPAPNELAVRLDPSTGVRLVVDAHRADISVAAPIELDMDFVAEGGEGPTPYEVLLHAAMIGNSTRFARQDGIEETWRVMQPLLDSPPPVHTYQPGSWGPSAAENLPAGFAPWRAPRPTA